MLVTLSFLDNNKAKYKINQLCHFCTLFDDLFNITDAESKPSLFSHDPIQICFGKIDFNKYLYRRQSQNKNIILNASDIVSIIDIEKYLCVYKSIIDLATIKSGVVTQLYLDYIEYLLRLDNYMLKFNFTVANQNIILDMIIDKVDISTLSEIICSRIGQSIINRISYMPDSWNRKMLLVQCYNWFSKYSKVKAEGLVIMDEYFCTTFSRINYSQLSYLILIHANKEKLLLDKEIIRVIGHHNFVQQ